MLWHRVVTTFTTEATINNSSTVTSTTVSSLNSNTAYRFRIKIIPESGEDEEDYGWSYISQYTALPSPTNLSSTAQTATSITLSWNAVY